MTEIDDVIAERRRQIKQEGWTPEHDDEHDDGSLSQVAACYALPSEYRHMTPRLEACDAAFRGDTPIWKTKKYVVPKLWPQSWHPNWWKPKDRRRDLVRAAALIVAEIERLDRLERNENDRAARILQSRFGSEHFDD